MPHFSQPPPPWSPGALWGTPQPVSAETRQAQAGPVQSLALPRISLRQWQGPKPSRVASMLTGREVKIHEFTRGLVFSSDTAQFAS